MVKSKKINITKGFKFGVMLLIAMVIVQACNPTWQDHYESSEDYIHVTLWDAINQNPDYSKFASYLVKFGLDSLLRGEQVNTVIITTNNAFEKIKDTAMITESLMKYHILQTIFIDRSIQDWRRMLTSSGKYVLIEAAGNGYYFDGIPLQFNSPLYLNGKYYEIPELAVPKPNLYEFTSMHSPVLKEYIDSKDSVYLDRSRSTPIGFDEDGNTLYDSIFGKVNLFEKEFFPVGKELRDENATLILFTQEQYDLALDEVAGKMGGSFLNRDDIPDSWQNKVLLPAVTRNAMFDGILSYNDLLLGRIKSSTGDTVIVEAEKIDPESRAICSNGVAFLYNDFSVPDDLFRGVSIIEGEDMIDSLGVSKFAWKKEVMVSGEVVEPEMSYASDASGGALVNISFGRDFNGEYSLSFTFSDLFPMRYRLEWRANARPSGLFAVYVNDQVLEFNDKFGNTFQQFDSYELINTVISVTGERFLPENGFNMRDYWVDHHTTYGDVTIRFEYVGQGNSSTNGLNIDYVKLIPDF